MAESQKSSRVDFSQIQQKDSAVLPQPKGKNPKLPAFQKEKSKKFSVKKRPPPKEYNRPNDIYIGERSTFESQIVKCRKLLDGDVYNEIFLHGLGKAIPKTINLAIKVKDIYFGTVDHSVNTTTVKLIDDLVPLDGETQPSQQHRTTSSVLIRVFRKVDIP